MRQVAELTALIADERVPHAQLEAFLRPLRGESAAATDSGYPAILAKAVVDCDCQYNDTLDPDQFTADILDELGEGYVLGEMPKSPEALARGYWTDADFDAYLKSPEVAGAGLEAAFLADLCLYGKQNPKKQMEVAIVCWRPTKNGRVAYLGRDDSERGFYVDRRVDFWDFSCRVLLRKVRQPAL